MDDCNYPHPIAYKRNRREGMPDRRSKQDRRRGPLERRMGCGQVHCFHIYRGPMHMVIPDGHVALRCCRCPAMKTQHADHACWR